MVKTTALGMLELTEIFKHKKPNIVFTVGDRFETMATAITASYMNIPLAHTMGGEVTGTIDEYQTLYYKVSSSSFCIK